MQVDTLQELLVEELKDIYHAENQLVKALPRMAKKTKNPQLREAFETHLKETELQIERLEQVFEQLGQKAKGKPCHAMQGLLEEAKEIMSEVEPDALDAALIAAAQKVEHYEIASYGTVRTWAKVLGEREVVKLLQQTLDEEGKTDKLLTKLAESSVNVDAVEVE